MTKNRTLLMLLFLPMTSALLVTGCAITTTPTAASTSTSNTTSASAMTAKDHNKTGDILNDQGRHDEAIVEYTKAIDLDPKYATAYNNRGLAYMEKG